MNERILYFGSYSAEETAIGTSRGIYCYRFDMDTGMLTFHGSEDDSFNPSFLTLSPDQRYLYAADEQKDTGMISAYQIDPVSHQVSFINRQKFPGGYLCNLNASRDGKLLFAANYGGGNVLSMRVQPNGGIGQLVSNIVHQGSSVNPVRQTKPYAHCMMPDLSGKHVIACDLGMDQLIAYDIDPQNGTLKQLNTCAAPAGEGPRHLIFDRNGDRAFLITEIGNHMIRYEYDQTEGRLIQRQMLSSLPEGSQHESTGADIHLSPDEKYLYASNRDISGSGQDTIVRYRFEGEELVTDGFIPVGKIPRGFMVTPDGRMLIVCCQEDNCVQVLESLSGKLLHQEPLPAPTNVVMLG